MYSGEKKKGFYVIQYYYLCIRSEYAAARFVWNVRFFCFVFVHGFFFYFDNVYRFCEYYIPSTMRLREPFRSFFFLARGNGRVRNAVNRRTGHDPLPVHSADRFSRTHSSVIHAVYYFCRLNNWFFDSVICTDTCNGSLWRPQ